MAGESIREAAIHYAAEYGLAVHPLKRRTKEPATQHGFKDATTNTEKIISWWGKCPSYNLACATGVPSGGIICLDVDMDAQKGTDGMATLRKWEAEHGALPDTASAITGRGGMHLYYRAEGEIPTFAREKLGVDVRGDGGYATLPPSVHPNGITYKWNKSPDEVGFAIADKNVYDFIDYLSKTKDKSSSGGRNETLYSHLVRLKKAGASDDAVLLEAEKFNAEKNNPPLDDGEVQKCANGVIRNVSCADGNRFNHADFGDELISERNFCFIDGVPAIRNGSRYEPGWSAVRTAMITRCRSIKDAQRREVEKYLSLVGTKREAAPKNLIAFRNGVLDIQTMRLRPLHDDDRILNVVPHNWNPEAQAQQIDEFLDSVSCHSAAVRANLEETAGMCLYRGSEFAKCPVLKGSGSNGKSTYIKALSFLVGTDNHTTLDPQTIGARFQSVALVGKTANLGDDIPSSALTKEAGAVFKKLVTGDAITAEMKGGETFFFTPYATPVFSVNDMPRLLDSSDGMMRRLHPIPFNARFERGLPGFDPNFSGKLTTEDAAQRFAVLAVEGLNRCITNGGMTESAESKAIMDDIRKDNDNVYLFCTEAVTRESVMGLEVGKVYEDYTGWAQAEGIQSPYRQKSFTSKVNRYLGLRTENNGRNATTREKYRTFVDARESGNGA